MYPKIASQNDPKIRQIFFFQPLNPKKWWCVCGIVAVAFLGGEQNSQTEPVSKKRITTQLLINIIIYSMNPIQFIHPIFKTQKTSNLSKVHLRGRFTQTTLKAAETSAPLVKEPAPRLGQGYAVMSVLTVIAWIITSILALARHPAVTWCLSGVTFFFWRKSITVIFSKKVNPKSQVSKLSRGGDWKRCFIHSSYWEMLFWGMYVMKVCFSRRKSCCDPMIMLWPHERLLEMMHWESLTFEVSWGGVLWMIHLKVQRTFTRELLDADYLQETRNFTGERC